MSMFMHVGCGVYFVCALRNNILSLSKKERCCWIFVFLRMMDKLPPSHIPDKRNRMWGRKENEQNKRKNKERIGISV